MLFPGQLGGIQKYILCMYVCVPNVTVWVVQVQRGVRSGFIRSGLRRCVRLRKWRSLLQHRRRLPVRTGLQRAQLQRQDVPAQEIRHALRAHVSLPGQTHAQVNTQIKLSCLGCALDKPHMLSSSDKTAFTFAPILISAKATPPCVSLQVNSAPWRPQKRSWGNSSCEWHKVSCKRAVHV